MGAGQVGSAFVEWIRQALIHDPILVAPTLILFLGIALLAVIDTIIVAVQVATAMMNHVRNRLSDLGRELGKLRATFRWHRAPADHANDIDMIRSRHVQRDLLSQQPLFDRNAKKSSPRSA